MPHLNQLQQAFGEQGLSVVGVTGEQPELTKPWVERHGARYPYAYDQRLLAYFSVTALPYAVLVDTEGTIIWKGSPAGLSPDLVKIAVRGAIKQPLYTWPPEAKAVKEALLKRNYTRALKLAKGLDPSFTKMIEARIGHLLASMKRARKRGDYLLSKELALRIFRECRGLPVREEAIDLLRELKQTPELNQVLLAQVQLRGLVEQAEKTLERKPARALLKQIKGMQVAHPGGAVAKCAAREAAILQDRMARMK